MADANNWRERVLSPHLWSTHGLTRFQAKKETAAYTCNVGRYGIFWRMLEALQR
jgi:hypothetical protein